MYSIKEVMKGLCIKNLSFHDYFIDTSRAIEIFTRGVYGGVRDDHEIVLALPDGEDILYVCSRRSTTDCFVIGYSVNSPALIRVMHNDNARTFMHTDYEEQLRKNSECSNKILIQSTAPEHLPTIVMYGVEVTDVDFYITKSIDFPSKSVTTLCNKSLNIIQEFCIDSHNFSVSKEKKEVLLNQLMTLVMKRKQYLGGVNDLRRCRVFMYENKAYIATKKREEQGYNIYALVQNSENKMALIKVNQYKIDELIEAAEKEFNKKC